VLEGGIFPWMGTLTLSTVRKCCLLFLNTRVVYVEHLLIKTTKVEFFNALLPLLHYNALKLFKVMVSEAF
jgi:hypothetical protein